MEERRVSTFGQAFAELAPLGTETQVSPDTLLWREGDRASDVVLLLEGTVEVTHDGPEGEEVILRTLGPGAILGEIASMDGLARSAAVKASTRCRVLRIPTGEFRALLQRRPDVMEELFWQQVRRVRSLTEQVVKSHRPAIIDRHTGLYNAAFFSRRLKAELERARETGDLLSIVLFEVDDYDVHLETQGERESGETLRKLAEILRDCGRRGDIISRLATARLAILLYGANAEDASRFSGKLQQRVLATPFAGGSAQPAGRLTVSAGVSTCPFDGTRSDVLLETAEMRLLRASAEGEGATRKDAGKIP
jgi:diguanylate cyclase (GGDEF)-like protein